MFVCIPQVRVLEVRDEVVASAALGSVVDAYAIEAYDVGVVEGAEKRRFLLARS